MEDAIRHFLIGVAILLLLMGFFAGGAAVTLGHLL